MDIYPTETVLVGVVLFQGGEAEEHAYVRPKDQIT